MAQIKYYGIALFLMTLTVQAQSVEGKLTLNGKTKTELKLESNSAVELFKDFKTGKYRLQFEYQADNLVGFYEDPKKEHKVVLFAFTTVVKKDRKVVKTLTRKQPMPYFPGDMGLPAEAFDFVGLLTSDPDEEEVVQMMKAGTLGMMPAGEYTVQLSVSPIGAKGKIAPVEFSFILRKRPGRTKY